MRFEARLARMMSQQITRRRFLEVSTAATAGAALAACTPTAPPVPTVRPTQTEAKPSPSPTPEKTGLKDLPRPDLKALFSENIQFQDLTKTFLARAMPLLPKDPKRHDIEKELFDGLESRDASAADLLFAIKGAATQYGRGSAMEQLWRKRQDGKLAKYGIEKLDEKRIDWALQENIDPRTLAIARDAMHPAFELLKAAPDLFFEAIPAALRPKTDADFFNRIPNAGAMAKLMMWETQNPDKDKDALPINTNWGHNYIGEDTSWNQVNTAEEWFPSSHEDLEWIAKDHQTTTGLVYKSKEIPGSLKCPPSIEFCGNASGGAIGPQFMPINARLFLTWYKEANKRIGNKYPEANLFDPFTATVLAYLYIASSWYHRQMNVDSISNLAKPGYFVGNDVAITSSYMKWNPHPDQIQDAKNAGYSFFGAFGRV